MTPANTVASVADRRDLLPLPSGPLLAAECAQCREGVWLRDGVKVLNDMGGRGRSASAFSSTAAQRQCLSRLRVAYDHVPLCPAELTAEGCLPAIFGHDPGYVDEIAGGKISTYSRGRVSLPRVATGAVDLAEALPDDIRALLVGETGGLLDTEHLKPKFAGQLCFDARLRRRGRLYGQFVADLFARGMLEVGDTITSVTPFFVPKKGSLIRLIFDTRDANQHFCDPRYVALAAAQALAGLEVEEGVELTIAQGDIACCFYQFLLPPIFVVISGFQPLPGETCQIGYAGRPRDLPWARGARSVSAFAWFPWVGTGRCTSCRRP